MINHLQIANFQDQYANYVVQKMIDVAESSQVSLISSLRLAFVDYLSTTICFFSPNFRNCWLLPYRKLMNFLRRKMNSDEYLLQKCIHILQ